MRLPRSYLFVPGDRIERYSKALASGADAVIIDLEDAVAPADKVAAREALRGWLSAQGTLLFPQVWIRVNACGTDWHADDLAMMEKAAVAGIVLPKSESIAELDRVTGELVPEHLVLPLIETARGVAAMRDIARGPRVQRLLFGSVDLRLDLGIQCDEAEHELVPYRAEMVLASRLAGLPQPVDGVDTALEHPTSLPRAVSAAKRMGFGAKLCVHPRQVPVVNQGFAPQAAELAWARKVLDAVRGSGGAAVAVEGKMIDAPVIAAAQRVLDQFEE